MVKALTALIVATGGLVTALDQLGIVGGGSSGTHLGKPAITMYPSTSTWDSNTYGSHWHAIVAWQTSGQVTSCTARDDRGNGPVPVDPNNAKYPLGSYLHTTRVVVVSVTCKGPGGTGDASINVQVPPAPQVRIKLVRAQAAWVEPYKKQHWQILLTWSSNGVDCSIQDDVQKRWLHKDPRGETAGPYGYFARSVKNVNLRFRCIDVAFVTFTKSFGVTPPLLQGD